MAVAVAVAVAVAAAAAVAAIHTQSVMQTPPRVPFTPGRHPKCGWADLVHSHKTPGGFLPV